MFRMANERTSHILDAKVSLMLVRNEPGEDGEVVRRAHDLPLARGGSALFSHAWTAVHPIGRESPLVGATEASLEAEDAELVVTLSGFDEGLVARHPRAPHLPRRGPPLGRRGSADIVKVLRERRPRGDYRRFHDGRPRSRRPPSGGTAAAAPRADGAPRAGGRGPAAAGVRMSSDGDPHLPRLRASARLERRLPLLPRGRRERARARGEGHHARQRSPGAPRPARRFLRRPPWYARRAPGAFRAKLRLLWMVLRDYANGSYRKVPWKSLAALAAAVAYVLSPVDLVPDVLFPVGLADDAVLLAHDLGPREAGAPRLLCVEGAHLRRTSGCRRPAATAHLRGERAHRLPRRSAALARAPGPAVAGQHPLEAVRREPLHRARLRRPSRTSTPRATRRAGPPRRPTGDRP